MESNVKLYPNTDASVWMRSCKNEIISPIHGKISGKIPQWLKGDLIRNGPGSWEVGEDSFDHLFDCSALLHRFSIENGDVTYQCRFLESNVYKRNKKANRIVVNEFGTKAVPDPCQTIFQRVSAIFKFKDAVSDNAMISVYPFGDELYTFTEAPYIHRINKETLETEKRLDLTKYLAIVSHTSHPHVEQGNVYNLAMSMGKMGQYHNIVCFPAKTENDCSTENSMFEEAQIVATIRARWPLHPSYMHTFGMTENYFIIVEQPLGLSVPDLVMKRMKNEPMAGSLQWYKDELTQINLICRKTGQLKCQFHANPFFYLHIINQYEVSDDYVVLDICSYKDASMLDCMYKEAIKNIQQNPDYANMFRSTSIRFVLPLNVSPKDGVDDKENLVNLPNTEAKAFLQNNGKVLVEWEKLCNVGCETPRINYDKHLGKPYRYYYAISSDVDSENPGTIIKVDTYNKTVATWCEENCYPSEGVFVPSPEAKSEDDGVVLSAMVWGGDLSNKVGLIILDATTMTEIGRAEFETKSPVPKCLHGWFVSK